MGVSVGVGLGVLVGVTVGVGVGVLAGSTADSPIGIPAEASADSPKAAPRYVHSSVTATSITSTVNVFFILCPVIQCTDGR